jgi:DNA-3-methyladenine glycosylase I
MSTITFPDGKKRCRWCASAPDFPGYQAYHDKEWGFPVRNDQRLFEKLSLELFQSGLSWRTILAKRENFRAAFKGFQIESVARFTNRDVTRLLKDAGIVRHRGKIEAVINNAKRAQELVARDKSLAKFIWSFDGQKDGVALSKELKRRGWRFVGPTTIYAFMQAMGLVNDHAKGCIIRSKVGKGR